MKRLSPAARSVLAEYRSEYALPPADRQRMAHALEQRLANGPPAMEIDAHAPRLPLDSIAPRAASSLALVGASAIGLAIVTAGWFAFVQRSQPPRAAPLPAVVTAPLTAARLAAPSAAAVAEPPAELAPALPRARVARTRAQDQARPPTPPPEPARATPQATLVTRDERLAPAPPAAPTQPNARASAPELADRHARQNAPETRAAARATPMVDDELALLRRAQDALRAGDPQRALVQLAEHRWRFPHGQLADSRGVARMLALCANGDRELARAEASEFLTAHPRSPFAARVRGICTEATKP